MHSLIEVVAVACLKIASRKILKEEQPVMATGAGTWKDVHTLKAMKIILSPTW